MKKVSLILFGIFLLFLASIVFFAKASNAATFCHVETGQCLDPQVNDTSDNYLKRYAAPVTAGWVVSSAPDGTPHNSAAVCTNGSCSYTPPAIPAPVAIPAVMTKANFQLYAYATLGAVAAPGGTPAQKNLAGIVRFGAVLLAMKASSDPGTAAALDGYNNNDAFNLTYVTSFLGLIGPAPGSAIVTSTEATAFITNWPNQ